SYAGLIVIHENRGLTEHIQDVVRRAAKEGFIALGVDLLSRQGGTEKVGDDARAAGFLSQIKPEDVVADLSSGVKFAQTQDEIKIYPDVGHAFHNDTGASWNEKAAVDAWQTAMAWHKKYLA